MPLQETDKVALTAIETAGQFFTAHMDLICDGDRPQGMLVIRQGFACQYKLRNNGKRQILAYLLPDNVCDLATAQLDRMDHGIGILSIYRAVWVAPWITAVLHRRPAVHSPPSRNQSDAVRASRSYGLMSRDRPGRPPTPSTCSGSPEPS